MSVTQPILPTIYDAVARCDIGLVHHYIRAKAPLDEPGPDGLTVAELAVRHGRARILHHLLAAGASHDPARLVNAMPHRCGAMNTFQWMETLATLYVYEIRPWDQMQPPEWWSTGGPWSNRLKEFIVGLQTSPSPKSVERFVDDAKDFRAVAQMVVAMLIDPERPAPPDHHRQIGPPADEYKLAEELQKAVVDKDTGLNILEAHILGTPNLGGLLSTSMGGGGYPSFFIHAAMLGRTDIITCLTVWGGVSAQIPLREVMGYVPKLFEHEAVVEPGKKLVATLCYLGLELVPSEPTLAETAARIKRLESDERSRGLANPKTSIERFSWSFATARAWDYVRAVLDETTTVGDKYTNDAKMQRERAHITLGV
jgi:hypothetical protein